MAEHASAARLRGRTATRSVPIRVEAGSLDFEWARRFLTTRMVPSVEWITADQIERMVWLEARERRPEGARPVALSIRFCAPASARSPAAGNGSAARLAVRSVPDLPAPVLRHAVVRMFDLDADLHTFTALARQDSVLGPVVATNPRGLRLLQLLDPFEALVRAILGQQVSVAAAATMTDRLVRLAAIAAPPLPAADIIPINRPRYVFPQAHTLAGFAPARLRTIGLTRAKAAAVRGAASAIASGELNLAALRHATPEEAERQLLSLAGVGPWTAAYVRLRALGDRDAFPAADLGLVRAFAARGIGRSGIEAVAERWRPWRGYATLHLWHSLHIAAPHP